MRMIDGGTFSIFGRSAASLASFGGRGSLNNCVILVFFSKRDEQNENKRIAGNRRRRFSLFFFFFFYIYFTREFKYRKIKILFIS